MNALARCLPVLLLCTSAVSMAQDAPQEPPPMLVEVETAQSQMVAEQIWVPGTVVSRSDSNIASEVAGRISWIAEVGDVVEAGQVLAKLDDHMLQLQLRQHQANITKWQARAELLARQKKRFATMAKQNNTSRNELDQILSDLAVAKQEVEQAKIDKQLTEYQLSQTQVKAPFSALVVERLQTPGEFTGIGNDLLRIVDTANVEASIRAPLSAVPYIQRGMEVLVKNKTAQYQESIRAIVPVGDARSRMMEIRVALNPGDFAIGSAVRVALPHSDFHQAITVPRDALVLRQTGVFIFKVGEEDMARQIPVQTGVGNGDRIEVIGELNATEQVIIRGAELLREGQKIRFEETAELAGVN